MSLTRHATAVDFTSWEERAQAMSIPALAYSARDAYEAARAADGHDPVAAGRYRDEAATYDRELRRRQRGAA